MQSYHLTLRELLPWGSIGKTAAAAIVAGAILLAFAWRQHLGFGLLVLASTAYLVGFALLVLALRVPEAQTLLEWTRRLMPLRAATSRRA